MTMSSPPRTCANEQLDLAIQDDAQPSEQTPPTSQNKRRVLCARCNRLQIPDRFMGVFEEPPRTSGSYPHDHIDLIYEDSLVSSCYLCTQFRPFFKDSPSSASAPRLYLDNRDIDDRSTQLSISYPRSYKRIYLFSTKPWEFWNPDVKQISTRAVAHCPLYLDTHFDGSSSPTLAPIPYDQNQAKAWMTRCLAQHSVSCNSPSRIAFKCLRLIDCERRQLCMSDEPYVCLSYLWGKTNSGQAPTDQDWAAQLPSTIADAIKVTLSIGIRYLWVDRYCIDQENADEKHSLIQNMDAIYNGAELTIIAASGSGPDYGLPGISRPRQGLATLNIGDHTFVAMQHPRDEIGNYQWNKRAWTYQEALLSRRRLVFTDTQMYFQCRASYYLDGLDSENVCPEGMPDFEAFPARGIGTEVFDVFDRLQEYYARSISFDTDIINAFSGVLSAFQDFASDVDAPLINHFYGVPIFYQQQSVPSDTARLIQLNTSFMLNLFWSVDTFVDDQTYDSSAKACFPSWAWAYCKAHRPEVEKLYFRHILKSEKYDPWSNVDEYFEVLVHHHSDGKMNLLDYIQHKDDYTAFDPRVELNGPTIRGTLSKNKRDEMKFSACPTPSGGDFVFQERPENLLGGIVAMYLGQAKTSLGPRVDFYFILLKARSDGRYRRVGVFVVDTAPIFIEDKPITIDPSNCCQILHRLCGNGDGEWQRETLVLV